MSQRPAVATFVIDCFALTAALWIILVPVVIALAAVDAALGSPSQGRNLARAVAYTVASSFLLPSILLAIAIAALYRFLFRRSAAASLIRLWRGAIR